MEKWLIIACLLYTGHLNLPAYIGTFRQPSEVAMADLIFTKEGLSNIKEIGLHLPSLSFQAEPLGTWLQNPCVATKF